MAEAGQRITTRYRLDSLLTEVGGVEIWLATDDNLGRKVQVVAPREPLRTEAAARVAVAALEASRSAGAHVAAVLDRGSGPDGPFFVTEHPLGPTLGRWSIGRTPSEVVRQVAAVARQTGRLHADGVVHGAIGPQTVTLVAGTPVLTSCGAAWIERDHDRAEDLAALVRLPSLLAQADAAAFAPLAELPLLSADRLGADLDAAAAALERVEHDAQRVAAADAARTLYTLPAGGGPPTRTRRDERRSRWPWLLAALALVVGAAVVIFALRDGDPETVRTPELVAALVSDVDPEGDGVEHSELVTRAVDQNPETGWTTEAYRQSRDFNGQKTGVGLLFDLGSPRDVTQVEILGEAGWQVELRGADERHEDAAAFTFVTNFGESPDARLSFMPTEPIRHQYWLVWITSLPEDLQATVFDVEFLALSEDAT